MAEGTNPFNIAWESGKSTFNNLQQPISKWDLLKFFISTFILTFSFLHLSLHLHFYIYPYIYISTFILAMGLQAENRPVEDPRASFGFI